MNRRKMTVLYIEPKIVGFVSGSTYQVASTRSISTNMSPTPGVRSLEGFSMIGTEVYLRDIREQGQDLDTTSPNVILIFGWMGAQFRHLRNYTHAYTKLYPNASQIVVRCNTDMLWTTISTRERRLMPVIDALEALHCLPSSSAQRRPRILTHVFSNGGSLQVTCLSHMLQQKYGSASVQGPLTSALILDSCPTITRLKALKLALSAIVRNPIVRYIVLTFAHVMYFVRFGLSLLLGSQMMLVADVHTDMWNPCVLPWMGIHTPRLYLFSRKDKLILWQEVMHHAKTAKERGMDVRCELFEESEHVMHIRVEPERYWSSVQEVWVVAMSKEKDEQRMSQVLPARQQILGPRQHRSFL
ncbi:hypothetical protein DEU56DRAFT_889024 [Suillus clintonianus]|uniref:uncharacterized protein n=1 Tax=Suillus clintonianus TaxID=1904413 RepID=UPI001B878C46|nr:uncharacterized protein DEU56DRAFT_889024 [Suillus clintonianus]KAG2132949.1 hypothetical protein DEU56DRAFT_889024 [Suillus clintonianus]